MSGMDIAVIGCGIAGASAAARLASFDRQVTLFEATAMAPYHTTARSAALKDPVYVPNASVSALARASADFLENPSPLFGPLLKRRGSMHIAAWRDLIHLLDLQDAIASAGVKHRLIERDELLAQYPYLEGDSAHAAIVTDGGVAHDIDVSALHAGFLRILRHMGGTTRLDEEVLSARRVGGTWRIVTNRGGFDADVLVIAAGPWADEMAIRCGVTPLGLQPLRRTIVVGDLDDKVTAAPNTLTPFTFWVGAQEDLYFRLERSGEIWISPADETPSAPCDAAAEEIDVATAIERLHHRTRFRIKPRLRSRWAGLRTFATDRKPVIGWDTAAPNLFWSVGYGGFGIECAPAASELVADLFAGDGARSRLCGEFGIDADEFSPARFRTFLSAK